MNETKAQSLGQLRPESLSISISISIFILITDGEDTVLFITEEDTERIPFLLCCFLSMYSTGEGIQIKGIIGRYKNWLLTLSIFILLL